MRKPDFCLCEKDADQLRSNCEADSVFVFATRIVFLNPKFQASIKPYSVAAQACLRQTCSETLKTCFLASRLIWVVYLFGLSDNIEVD